MINWITNKIYNHFFKPEKIKDLSVIRIVLVSVELFFLLSSLLGLSLSNGANLEVQKFAASLDPHEFFPIIVLKILLAPLGWGIRPEFMLLQAIWIIAIISGFTSLFGIYKRLSLFIFAITNTILVAHKYSYWEQHHHEAVLILFLWILAFGDNFRTWSFDNIKRKILIAYTKMKFEQRKKDAVDIFARWPIRLMQWIFVLTYFSAGLEKIKRGFNSYSLMYSFTHDGILHHREIALWLAGNPFILKVFVPVTLVFELTFILVMFFPRITWVYVLFGSLFHVSIFIIQAPPFLHYLALYIVFIEPIRNTLKKQIGQKEYKYRKKWKVIYDGNCPLCIRTMTIIDYLDLLSKLNFFDLENELIKIKEIKKDMNYGNLKHSIHLIDPNGRTYQGFFAFRKLTLLLPIFWILIPFLYFPLVGKIGNYIYIKVAENRKDIKCDIQKCIVD